MKNVKGAREEMIRQARGKVMNYAVKESAEEEEMSGREALEQMTDPVAPLTFDRTNEQHQ